jgi:hypothetical protein
MGDVKLRLLPLAAALWCSVLIGGHAAAAPIAPIDTVAPVATNDFIPENANIGDCVSSLPRPGCGSEARSDTGQLLTFGALLLGSVFIGWRIVRSVRQRESAADQPVAAEGDGSADQSVR